MATTIVTKNSSTASAVPTAGQLVQGELAVNVADKRLYTEDNAGAIVELGTNPSTLTVTGEITANGGIALGDNDKATFGAGDDLEIYHDGSNSYITESGVGNLYLAAGNLYLRKTTGENLIYTTNAGAVIAHHNGSQKLATTATGIDVTGTATMDGLTVDGDVVVASTVPRLILSETDVTNGNWDFRGSFGNLLIRSLNDDLSTAVSRLGIAAGGDISFYEDTGTTAKLTWSASNEDLNFTDNVKATFGASDDLQIYHNGSGSYIDDAGTGNLFVRADNLQLRRADGSHLYLAANAGAEVALYHAGNSKLSTTATGIDVTGTVTADGLTVDGDALVKPASGSAKLYLQTSNTTSDSQLIFGDSSNNNVGGVKYSHSNDAMRFEANGTERMRIDSSGNVGIGTSTPAAKLHIETQPSGAGLTPSGNGDELVLENNSNCGLTIGTENLGSIFFGKAADNDIGGIGYSMSDNSMRFTTNTAERLRIDSSGRVLVGTTSANGVDGVTINNGGYVYSNRAGGVSGYFDRGTSDGSILEFRKDGTAVGSIGTDSGDLTIYGTVAGHTGFRFGNGEVYPTNNGGSLSDNTMSLGSTSIRFTDLYLSGGVYLGGTGAANHLDDYEEGTCNMKWSDGTNHSTVIASKYTKVGRLVTVSGYASGNISGLTGATAVQLAGFPFAFSDYGSFALRTRNINAPAGCIGLIGFHGNSGAFATLTFIVDNANYVSVLVSDMSATTNDAYFDVTYQTT
jgi:hypothetical protein